MISTIVVLCRKDTGKPMEDEGWGPLMVTPWTAKSLHDFWGTRWHQVIRLHLLALGGFPLSTALRAFAFNLPFPMSQKSRASLAKNLGNAGLVCGTFFASAFIHQFSIAPTIDPATGLVPNASGRMGAPTIIYFSIQAIGIGMEKIFRAISGRPVGGLTGQVWVCLWIIGGGQFLCTYYALSCATPSLSLIEGPSETLTNTLPSLIQGTHGTIVDSSRAWSFLPSSASQTNSSSRTSKPSSRRMGSPSRQ